MEIDNKKLYTINYLELLNILKSLTNKIVTIVCARKRIKKFNNSASAHSSRIDNLNTSKKMSKRAKSEGKYKFKIISFNLSNYGEGGNAIFT